MLGLTEVRWDQLGDLAGINLVNKPELLFKRLEDKEIAGFRKRFAGRKSSEEESLIESFRSRIELKVGKIIAVEKHPKADKLYIETVDLGSETRRIVSGLVPYYAEKELLGRNIILVVNLKPARLRGVESKGMLLAAQDQGQVEVLFADQARLGAPVIVSGSKEDDARQAEEIDIEEFLGIPIEVKEFRVLVGDKPLECAGVPVTTEKVKTGMVK